MRRRVEIGERQRGVIELCTVVTFELPRLRCRSLVRRVWRIYLHNWQKRGRPRLINRPFFFLLSFFFLTKGHRSGFLWKLIKRLIIARILLLFFNGYISRSRFLPTISDIITLYNRQLVTCRNSESKSICRRCLQPEVVKNSKESRSRKWWYLLLDIVSKFGLLPKQSSLSLVALVMTFSKVISLSLSLSLYASPILSHRSKQFQRYNDGWLFQHDAERRSYRSIPSDKNDRNYKKIHNSIYTVTRAIHTRLDYRAHFSLSFFSFFSFLRRQF